MATAPTTQPSNETAQGAFLVKWRDAILDNPEWRIKIQVDWTPETPTRADTLIRTKFAEQAIGAGLDPATTWESVNRAGAAVSVARREGNYERTPASGFTTEDLDRLDRTVVLFKADLRDRIAFGSPQKVFFVAEDLGLNPAITQRQAQAAAAFIVKNDIHQPDLTSGFSRQEYFERRPAPEITQANHKGERSQSTSPGFAI